MSWTQGQPNCANQSPFVDPIHDNQRIPQSSPAGKPTGARYSANNQRQTPSTSHVEDTPAATFTKEGLQTFSVIFSSSVEAAIAKTLPDLIERAVDAKIHQLLSSIQRHLVIEISRQGEQMVQDLLRLAVPAAQTEDVRQSELPDPANTSPSDELHQVLEVLKDLGRPVTSEELREMMPDIYWGSNFSAKLNYFIAKSNGRLERAARGIYAYRQTAL